jgi:hypothetical protein
MGARSLRASKKRVRMRVASQLAWISVGLFFAACSDEKPAPIVNEDIEWHVGCEEGKCGPGLATHAQAVDLDKPFSVICGRNGSFFEISIRDPGREDLFVTAEGEEINPRPPSVLKLTNVTEAGGCDVEVSERDINEIDPIPYQAKCGKGCELENRGAEEGWDFVGELTCDGLLAFGNDAEDAAKYNLKQNNGDPVLIKVANCD